MSKPLGFYQRLKQLNRAQQQLFALALCQRMAPNFKLFCQQTNKQAWLDTYEQMLTLLWRRCGSKKTKINYETSWEKLESITPSPDEFDLFLVHPASDAVTGLISVLNAFESVDNDEDFINLSKLSTSTVVNYIGAAEDIDVSTEILSDEVYNHEFMQAEREDQDAILQWCEQVSKIDSEICTELRNSLIEIGCSNLGVQA